MKIFVLGTLWLLLAPYIVCVFYDIPADFMAFKGLYKILTDNFFT